MTHISYGLLVRAVRKFRLVQPKTRRVAASVFNSTALWLWLSLLSAAAAAAALENSISQPSPRLRLHRTGWESRPVGLAKPEVLFKCMSCGCRGNLSPLSIGLSPRQAMDLDAAHTVEPMGPGSTSSPHTTPPSNSGEHSMSHSTTQRNSTHGTHAFPHRRIC